MKVFITGGTGFIGRNLTAKLVEQGHSVTILTRSIPRNNRIASVSYVGGNPLEKGAWQNELDNHDVVINLAGASIFRRWTAEAKKNIRNSRILTTKNIVEALPAKKDGKITLLNASAVGFYGFRGDETLDESSTAGHDFLSKVVQEWETAARAAEEKGVRVVLCRFGVVLGGDGGALNKMIPVFKYGFGSPLGNGKQWFSWIHINDLVDAVLFLMAHQDVMGPVNCTSPYPVTNKEMSNIVGKVLNRPVFMPAVPPFLVKLFAGEFGSVFLKGQKVIPAVLLAESFGFRHPQIDEALAGLVDSR